jgi:hypothetical protein
MAAFGVHMRQRIGAMAEFEYEQHASSAQEARTIAQGKFPVHDVIAVRKLETLQHDAHVQVAAALLKLARLQRSIPAKAASFFAKPIAEMGVNIKEAVERRIRAGETSIDSIAQAIFDQILAD